MNLSISTFLAAASAVLLCGFNTAKAAPVTLEWVTTSSSTSSVTYGCEGCFNLGQPFAQTRTGTSAGISASFMLADASLLDQQTLTFSNQGFKVASNSIIVAAVSATEQFVNAGLLDDGSIGISNTCFIGSRSRTSDPGLCSVSAVLARDTSNVNRYFGSLSFKASSNTSGITVGADQLTWFGPASTASAVNSLALGGYWQVVGANNIPLPSGFVLLVSGLGLLFAMRRR
jgi:hypothetical protein